MLGQSQVQASGRVLDDAVRTYRENVGSSTKVIGGLLGVRREITEGDRELVGNAPEVCRKMIKSLPRVR
ncbi:hypothetical protein BHE74_00039260 [Ensete ventricosum]|nr:hypothetical protein GW17_00032154 [Ensete ventricosum]RWW54198.1 hypothetical protein BHE74_00039260 [Ensete ventricosum]